MPTASDLLQNVLNGPTASASPHPAPEDKIPWSNTPPYQRGQAQSQLIPASLHGFPNKPVTSPGKKRGHTVVVVLQSLPPQGPLVRSVPL